MALPFPANVRQGRGSIIWSVSVRGMFQIQIQLLAVMIGVTTNPFFKYANRSLPLSSLCVRRAKLTVITAGRFYMAARTQLGA